MTELRSYKLYQRFLTEVERKFAAEIIGKSDKEKRAMLQLTQRIIDSYVGLYGDKSTNGRLTMDARMVIMQGRASDN